MLSESAACTAIDLFEFVCLIKHDKGWKPIFLEEKHNILQDVDRHLGTNVSLVNHCELLVTTVNMIIKNCHVNEEDAN
jgi:hypothetical protein